MTNAGASSPEELLASIWRFLQLAVHRYRAGLTGEALMVLTIIVLDRNGYSATVSELANFVGIPKSNVSRYISKQISIGHLNEFIDPADRRRRLVQPTEKGRTESDWLLAQINEVADLTSGEPEDFFSALKAFSDKQKS